MVHSKGVLFDADVDFREFAVVAIVYVAEFDPSLY